MRAISGEKPASDFHDPGIWRAEPVSTRLSSRPLLRSGQPWKGEYRLLLRTTDFGPVQHRHLLGQDVQVLGEVLDRANRPGRSRRLAAMSDEQLHDLIAETTHRTFMTTEHRRGLASRPTGPEMGQRH